MTHSVDDRLFLTKQDSTRLLHLLTRFASEPQMSIYQNQSSPLQAHSQKNTDDFDFSSPPVSKTCLQFDIGDIQFDEIFHFNCDKNQPISTATTDDPSYEQVESTSPEASNDQQIDEEILLDGSPSMQETDSSGERHFRRRKRRSSLTRGSISLDETPTLTDATGKLDTDQAHESKHSVNETVELSLSIQANDTPAQPTPTSVTEEVNGTIHDEEEKPASVSRYRGRSKQWQQHPSNCLHVDRVPLFWLGLRHRFYRQVSASPEITSTAPVNFYLPDEALDVESPRIQPRNPLSSISISPLLSPVSPPSPPIPAKDSSTPASPSALIGALKRGNSLGTTKKMVRFADSMGLELTQVQYIRSVKAEESKELSFLLGSSVLSSSPPSFSKSHLYLPNQSHLEHKPWSFDVAVPSKQISSEKGSARRFFCLYRQPNSEHPDIYLHEIWKTQIKLEHADIPRYQSSIGEQYLIGTIWVSNAGFAKHVSIKYTFNRWINTYEHEAQHRRHSGDFRNLDLFEFHIDVPADVDRVDFVLRYCVNGQEYWDNNDGKNYTLQTESAYTPQTTISLPHDCDFNEMRFYWTSLETFHPHHYYYYYYQKRTERSARNVIGITFLSM